jgi:DNA-binding XRE family transcriptional regulator
MTDTCKSFDTALELMAHLRAARRDLGIDQAVLARQVGVSRQTVSELESTTAGTTPNPKIETVIRMAGALGYRLVLVADNAAGAGVTTPKKRGVR